MTPVKNGWRGYIIQTLTAILLVGSGAIFTTIVWPAIEKNTEDIVIMKNLRHADYAEFQSVQQAIRADQRTESTRSQLMDSLILDKLEEIDEKIGF